MRIRKHIKKYNWNIKMTKLMINSLKDEREIRKIDKKKIKIRTNMDEKERWHSFKFKE